MVKSSVKSDTVEFIDHLERREAIGKFCEYLFLFGLLIGTRTTLNPRIPHGNAFPFPGKGRYPSGDHR